MKSFCVWIQPLANTYKVRVLGIKNAQWLLPTASVSPSCSGQRSGERKRAFPCCTFSVPYRSKTRPSRLEKLLASVPEVRLMLNLV